MNIEAYLENVEPMKHKKLVYLNSKINDLAIHPRILNMLVYINLHL